LLAFTCTEYELYSCIQLPKTKSSKESTINSYAWYLKAIPSKFSCATFQKLSTTSHFVPLFLAHGDIVVGIAIFHIKLAGGPRICAARFRIYIFAIILFEYRFENIIKLVSYLISYFL
jgi:hypothetical protein